MRNKRVPSNVLKVSTGTTSMKRQQLKKRIPFQFVLDELASEQPVVRPMFGCYAIYINGKIIFALRDKPSFPNDNGVWIATTKEHHESLRKIFPSMRSIGVLGKVTGWQILPSSSDDFEEAALTACRLAIRHDPRIGKIPQARKRGRTNRRKKDSTPLTKRRSVPSSKK